MVKVEAYSYSDFTSSPFEHEVRSIFPTLSPSSLNSAMRSAALYAELAYYLPGGMPQDSAGQVVLRSSLSQLTPLGGGGFFYDNYFFDAGFAGGRGLIDFTPEEVANWFLDKGEIRWREGASREYCATAVGPCVVSGFLDWSGTAHLVSFSTGQSSDVSEPRSLLLIGLGLFAVVYCRRRRISYMTVSNHSGQ